jgi:hypothetical protein
MCLRLLVIVRISMTGLYPDEPMIPIEPTWPRHLPFRPPTICFVRIHLICPVWALDLDLDQTILLLLHHPLFLGG